MHTESARTHDEDAYETPSSRFSYRDGKGICSWEAVRKKRTPTRGRVSDSSDGSVSATYSAHVGHACPIVKFAVVLSGVLCRSCQVGGC